MERTTAECPAQSAPISVTKQHTYSPPLLPYLMQEGFPPSLRSSLSQLPFSACKKLVHLTGPQASSHQPRYLQIHSASKPPEREKEIELHKEAGLPSETLSPRFMDQQHSPRPQWAKQTIIPQTHAEDKQAGAGSAHSWPRFNTTIQYNTSWGTETPPGTSLQAYFVAHGRSNIVRNRCNCTIPYPLLRHSACGAPVTPRGSDMPITSTQRLPTCGKTEMYLYFKVPFAACNPV